MAVSSDTCRSLNSPFVCLLLKIVEPSGQICQRSFEMTIPQFQVLYFVFHVNAVLLVLFIHDILSLSYFFFLQNFYKQFKEMAAVMETV